MLEPNALTGAAIDRAADRRRRDPAWLGAQRADPSARVVMLGDAGVRAVGGRVELQPLADVEAALALGESDHANEFVLLGLDGAGPVYALDEDAPRAGKRARLIGAGGMRGEAPPEAEGASACGSRRRPSPSRRAACSPTPRRS